MQINQNKIALFLLTILVALAVLLGGYRYYSAAYVENPMVDKIEKISSVQSAQLETSRSGMKLTVMMGKTDNIQAQYNQLEEVLQSYSSKPYTIKVKDKRDQNLQSVYDDLQVYVYEALGKNDYVQLNEQLKKTADRERIVARVLLDGEHLYIQLEKGPNYLYEVIDRLPENRTQEADA